MPTDQSSRPHIPTAEERRGDLETAHTILSSALAAARRQDEAALQEDLRFLSDPDPHWLAIVSKVAFRHVDNALAGLWTRGWQPADVARLVQRGRSRDVNRLLATFLAHEARSYRTASNADPEWIDQLADFGAREWWHAEAPVLTQIASRFACELADVLRVVVEIVTLCGRLPPLAKLRPDPTNWAEGGRRRQGSVDTKLLARVRGLLDKAESTEFTEEAEALTGKAQELMTRYSIDASMLDSEESARDAEGRRISIHDPYARQKASLLTAVGRANGCNVIYSPGYGFCTVLGMPRDLGLVELLHASLLLQATRSMLAAGAQRDGLGRSTTRSFRTSFLTAFASRIGQRLREATRAATTEAERQYGADLLPVLARRDVAVRELTERLLPGTRTMRAATVTNGQGWSAGVAAADSADLSTGHRVGRRPAIDR
jgi:hypothetical protein